MTEWPTQAMIEAGADVLFRQSPAILDEARSLAEVVYLAMEAARPKSEIFSPEELARLEQMAQEALRKMMTPEQITAVTRGVNGLIPRAVAAFGS